MTYLLPSIRFSFHRQTCATWHVYTFTDDAIFRTVNNLAARHKNIFIFLVIMCGFNSLEVVYVI